LPGGAVGIDQPVILADGLSSSYRQRGTLADWQAGVGALAGEHCLVRFAVAVGFAGTLLDLSGSESGVFHFFGRSSEGKTTCVRAASSVWGSGADGGFMRSWRATANGLEGNLAAACDTLLPLDEVGQAEGKEIGAALYMATAGIGKQRLRRDASLRSSYKWRVLILSSGELPIEARLNEDMRRGRAHAGHLVRAVDIAVRRDHGAFDHYPDFDSLGFANDLKQAALTHYGTAGPEFVHRLIEQDVTAEDVRDYVTPFVQFVLAGIKDFHGQAARAAARFALVAFAGELAIKFGIVPWVEGAPTGDGKELFKAWLEDRGGAVPYEAQQIVAQVRHFIEAHGDSRFDDLDPPPKKISYTGEEIEQARRPVINRAGWRRGVGENRRWYVLPEVWKREICAGINPTEAARVLAEIGALEKGVGGKTSRSERLLPGGKTQRVYVQTPPIFEGSDEGSEGD
jgi:uncharacterized protein (DUF927 family)